MTKTELYPTAHGVAACDLYSPRTFNRLTRQRFCSTRYRALVLHLGRTPSVPEQILIQRVARLEFELRKFDDAMVDGVELSGHALRARLAAENRLRLDLKALGLEPQTAPDTQLDAIQIGQRLEAERRARQAEAAA